jgi:predicted RNA-binding protein with RPS1 domain
MKSILSIVTFLSFFNLTIFANDSECQCACTVDDLIEAQDLNSKYEKHLKACTYKEEMHQKVIDLYTKNNVLLKKSMEQVNAMEDKKKKEKNAKKPMGWEDQKASLEESIEEIEEELVLKKKKFEKMEKELKTQITELQAELASLA